jgi:hypothetical protein
VKVYTRPLMVTGLGEPGETAIALEALPLRASGEGTLYNELWLQELLQRNPHLLPVDQIEPALTPLVPVCMELPTPAGPADNLMMTPDGGLVLVEAKLWRNPEARRQVVGQVLDYAKELARWSYEELQAAVRLARREPGLDLYELVCGPEAAPEGEATFVDAVSRNLRLGRLLLIVAGDGIQESAEKLAEFLQRHLGLHFTLAMVEISLWRAPTTGAVFVQPKVLARTVQIERAVIRLEGGVAMSMPQITPASPRAKPVTLTSEGYWEALAALDPTLPDRLQAFLRQAEAIGVYADVQRGMSLRWRSAEGREFTVSYVKSNGQVGTDWVNGNANEIGRLDLAHDFQRDLASRLPGAAVKETPQPIGWRVVVDGRSPSIDFMLSHSEAWLEAMKDYIASISQALGEPQTHGPATGSVDDWV